MRLVRPSAVATVVLVPAIFVAASAAGRPSSAQGRWQDGGRSGNGPSWCGSDIGGAAGPY